MAGNTAGNVIQCKDSPAQMAHDSTQRPPLLLTRPGPQSRRFARDFAATFGADWPIVISPLSRLDFLDPSLALDGVGTLIFTSETGVAGFLRLTDRRDLRAWCVGGRTAEVARAAGMPVVVGPGDGAGMIQQILADPPAGAMLHVHGRHMAVDVAEVLTRAGLRADGVTVYDQVALPLTPEAVSLLQGPDRVLLPLFSPRGARLMAQTTPSPRAPLLVAAISQAVADGAAPLLPRRLEVAREPNAAMMLDALQRLIAAEQVPPAGDA